jgi:hypothetical protein
MQIMSDLYNSDNELIEYLNSVKCYSLIDFLKTSKPVFTTDHILYD